MMNSEDQARLHEEYVQQKKESERKRRIRDGMCVVCGKSLAFGDKVARRHHHKSCHEI